jgi:hypothetical protein
VASHSLAAITNELSATRQLLIPTLAGGSAQPRKKSAEPIAILMWNLLHDGASYLNIRARCGVRREHARRAQQAVVHAVRVS